ncbi:hypothetical protein WDW37_18690 [Bdellovibrionota bacterium FG-1]
MKPTKLNLNPRDRELLYFLWKWKVCTTAGIARAIFPSFTPQSAYVRLWQLERASFIQCNSDRIARCHIWTLTRQGFERVQKTLPPLKEEGFKSENLLHDLVTTAIHLGNFMHNVPDGTALFSEQELRRLPLEFYPPWVPRSDRHRPDGYWYVPIGRPMATVALEVELSRKKEVEYEIIADFYAGEPQVIRVLWLTPVEATSHNLHSKIANALRGRPMIHNFVSYLAFVQAGWEAPIECGPEQGKSIGFLLGEKPLTSRYPVSAKFLLDTRKSPHTSATWRPLDLDANRY